MAIQYNCQTIIGMPRPCEGIQIIVWQLYCMAVNFFDNCTVWPWPCECIQIIVWQLYCMAVNFFDNCTVWPWPCEGIQILVWQLYRVAVSFFDNCTVWPWHFKNLWLKFDNCTVWLWTFLTIVLYGHSLDVLNFINRTPLLDVFSWKNHSKMQFDNCTGWLWPMISFWQLYCVAVSFFWQLYCMAVSPYYFLTIVLLFALKFFDNFPIWQKYRNPFWVSFQS